MVLKINKRIIQEATGEASSDDEKMLELQDELKQAHTQIIEKSKTISELDEANRRLREHVTALEAQIGTETAAKLKDMFNKKPEEGAGAEKEK